MSFQKYKIDSDCVGVRHGSATKNDYVDLTSKGIEVLISFCSIFNRKKSITVSGKTIHAERWGDFFENLGEKRPYVSRTMAKNAIKSPSRFLKLTAYVATAAACRSPKSDSSNYLKRSSFITQEKYYMSEILYQYLPSEWNKKNKVIPISTTIRKNWSWTKIRKKVKGCS